jgi:uncharacterized protein with PQ loop repeat
MKSVEVLSLLAGLFTMVAPGAQALKTLRARQITGLSLESYVLYVIYGVMGVVIGVQYGVVAITAMNALQTIFNAAVLYLISRRALALLVGSAVVLIGLAAIVAPWFLQGLVGTRWSEPFAFAYGLVGASTYIPQVLLTRRTRAAAAISLPNVLLMTLGMICWVIVAVLLHNWSLTFWNGLVLLVTAELLRLKLVLDRRVSQAAVLPQQ